MTASRTGAETLEGLLAGTLDAAAFTHLDHVAVAHEALRRYDFETAHARVAAGIQALADRAGAPEKFNATITFAYMSAIAERMDGAADGDFGDFLDRSGELLSPEFLAQRYSPARLHSPLARRTPLLPDLPGAAGPGT